MAAKGKIIIDVERCKGCHVCTVTCPRDLLVIGNDLNRKGYQPPVAKELNDDGKGCTACTSCALVCPEVAIEVYRVQ